MGSKSGAHNLNKGKNTMLKKKQFKQLKRKKYDSEEEEEKPESENVSNILETAEDETDNLSSNLNKENNAGNEGWADAMAKILGKSLPSKKTVILSRAKTEQPDKIISSEKQESNEIEIDRKEINNDGSENIKKESHYNILRQNQEKKKTWESLGRKKVDVTEKDYERNLTRIATRGVVQLFNAVQQQQKTLDTKLKTVGTSERKREEILKTMDKGAFLDLLKGTKVPRLNQQKVEVNDDAEKSCAWSALREDFMLDAKMKDWDKEDENEIAVEET